MAVPGVYTIEEQNMLEQWKAEADAITGWVGDDPIPGEITYPVFHRVATKDLILNMANGIYDPNPLFRDEHYASRTRWGTIIAPPFFEHCICHMGPIFRCKVPREIGEVLPLNFATCWDFFKPIRLGDSFRVWCSFSWEDDSDLEGKGPRVFLIKEIMKFLNQKNEVVCNKTGTRLIAINNPEEPKKEPVRKNLKPRMEEYKYTNAELDYIDRVSDSEVIQGSKIRWWEDVNVGDELQPIVKGPITPWDLLMEITGLGVNALDTRQMRKLCPQGTGQDRETNVWHTNFELHLIPKTAPWSPDPLDHIGYTGTQDPVNHIGMTMEDHAMARVITNWMGDDAFLKSTNFRVVVHPPIGDTLFGRGKVIKKHITDDGEHVVEIVCWLEGIRGFIHNTGTAIVGLMSRETIDKDIQRY